MASMGPLVTEPHAGSYVERQRDTIHIYIYMYINMYPDTRTCMQIYRDICAYVYKSINVSACAQ